MSSRKGDVPYHVAPVGPSRSSLEKLSKTKSFEPGYDEAMVKLCEKFKTEPSTLGYATYIKQKISSGELNPDFGLQYRGESTTLSPISVGFVEIGNYTLSSESYCPVSKQELNDEERKSALTANLAITINSSNPPQKIIVKTTEEKQFIEEFLAESGKTGGKSIPVQVGSWQDAEGVVIPARAPFQKIGEEMRHFSFRDFMPFRLISQNY